MSARFWLVAPIVAVAAAIPAKNNHVATTASAQTGTSAEFASTLDQQVDLAMTVYNSDLALVRDVREVELPSGTFDLQFQDIAATVNPATVHFRSLSAPARVRVLEQNYEYDLLEPDKLLRKYVGRSVTLVRPRRDGPGEELIPATLLSYNSAPVWRIGNEIVTGLHPDHIRFPELPENLHARPTLIWALENTGTSRHRVEAAYLASKLSWNADYVLTVSRTDDAADLDGWVTVTNGSGTSFRNASLQLVAGELNRVRREFDRMADMLTQSGERAAAAPAMTQEAFSEYHLYTVGRKTTINNNETKQLTMLNGTGVPVQKRYVVNGRPHYYRSPQPGAPVPDKVEVYYRLRNDAASGLGMPMPAGVVRVYQGDTQGGVQFAGEDRIAHTPKDETLDLRIGNAFDIVAERKQTDFSRIATNVYEMEYELRLRNHKATPATVEINEPIGGDWRMLRSTHEATKTAAFAAQFRVAVPADEERVVRYRVRVTY
jgi:hypothetical protein